MTEKILLKDILFNKEKVTKIAEELYFAYPLFKKSDFLKDVLSKFPKLELKARISWIAECLKKYLPENYESAIKIILESLPKPNNPLLSDNDFGDFIYAPYAEYVAKNGCKKEYLELSLKALREITKRFSTEDAIRYFLNAFSEETLKELTKWSEDSHYHVRRLCSEGTRTKLPWSQKINIPITKPVPILDNLFCDKTRFVTRSVANHINDISKINPNLAIKILEKWKKSKKQEEKEMNYIINHGLRTLIKKGHKEAVETIGFSSEPKINLSKFYVTNNVKIGTILEFSFCIKSEEDTNLIIDYIIHFQNKSGKLNNKKVYKLKKLTLLKNRVIKISKKHMLHRNMTTRTLYPGKHKIEIQINGKIMGQKTFNLKN